MRVLLPIIFLLLAGCFQGPEFYKQDSDAYAELNVDVTDSNGIVSGSVSSGATTTQIMSASSDSAIAGTSVAFPPGSLAFDTEVTIEQASAIANASTASNLGIDSSALSSASNAVVVSSSTPQDASSPFALEIPIEGNSLALNGYTNLVVIFKVTKVSDGGKVVVGVIPRKNLSINDGKAKFETKHFGSFQLAYSAVEINDEISADSNTPILTSREENELPEVKWGNWENSVNAAERKINFKLSVEGLGSIVKCILNIDDNKSHPFIKSYDLGNKLEAKDFHATSADEQNMHAKYVCEDSNGRTEESPWSDAAKINQLVASVSSSGTTYTVSGEGVKKYAHAFSSTEAGCSSAVYGSDLEVSSTFAPSSSSDGYVCVKGKDAHGNTSAPATSFYSAPVTNPSTLAITGMLALSVSPYTSNSSDADRTFVDGDSQSSNGATLSGTCNGSGGPIWVSGDIEKPGSAGTHEPFSITCNSSNTFSLDIAYGATPDTTTSGFGAGSVGSYRIGVFQDANYVFTVAFRFSSVPTIRIYTSSNVSSMRSTMDTNPADFYILNSDITLNSGNWSGPLPTTFTGTFEGQGYEISGLNISNSNANAGMFKILSGARISNLVFDGGTVNNGTFGGTGLLAGSTASGSTTKIKYIDVKGSVTITGGNDTGGLIGKAENAEIRDILANSSNITLTGSAAGVGGIVGRLRPTATLEYSDFVNGDVNGSDIDVGGAVGWVEGTIKAVKVTDATIDSTGSSVAVGGVAGRASSTGGTQAIKEIACEGCTITSTQPGPIGSLIGKTECSASGTIDIDNVYSLDNEIDPDNNATAGGIVGEDTSAAGCNFYMDYVWVSGQTFSTINYSYVGPLIGRAAGAAGYTISSSTAFFEDTFSCPAGTCNNGTYGASKSLSNLQTKTTYSTAGFSIDDLTTTGSYIWLIDDGNDVPVFSWED